MNKMLESFISESRDNLEEAGQCFLALENAPGDSTIMQNLFRAMHTIKGSSGLFEIAPLTKVMHVAEDILDIARSGGLNLTSDHIDVLLDAMDQITHWIDELEAQEQLGADADDIAQPIIANLKKLVPKDADDETASSDSGTENETNGLGHTDQTNQDNRQSINPADIAKTSHATRRTLFDKLMSESDASAFVVTYTPEAGCFFSGDDPLHTVLVTPELVDFHITEPDHWPAIEALDPYDCRLSFQVLASANLEALNEHFKYVAENTTITEVSIKDLCVPSGDFAEDTALFADLHAPLQDAINNENWQKAATLLPPYLNLANPSTYEFSCLDWLHTLVDQETPDSQVIQALWQAFLHHEFVLNAHNPAHDLRHSDNEDEEDVRDSIPSRGDEAATGSTAQRTNTSSGSGSGSGSGSSTKPLVRLNDMQRMLLGTQTRMLEMTRDEDFHGRVESVHRIITTALKPNQYNEAELNSVVDVCYATLSAQGLIDFVDQIREVSQSSTQPVVDSTFASTPNSKSPTKATANTASSQIPTEGVKHGAESGSDELSLAELVKAEQLSRDPNLDSEAEETRSIHPADAASRPTSSEANKDNRSGDKTSGEKGSTNRPQVLKVDQHRIDLLMDLVGELVVAKNSLPYLAKKAEEEFGVRPLAKEIKSQYAVINRLAESMQSTMMQIRMVPVSSIFQRFPRLVRDLSRKLGKNVRLVLEGEQTEADKNVVENLADPLIHLVRNSLDHGLENENERASTSKPNQCTLTLRAIPKDDQVIIEVHDDGRGIDPKRLKRIALRKGIIDENKFETLSDEEALYLIFAPGFSTAEEISDLSGRGVGMDVVNGLVQQAGGKVTITSEMGVGTSIKLYLPLTMAVSRVMMVEVNQQSFGISMEHIVETVKVKRERLTRIKQDEAIVIRNKVIPVLSLHGLLGLPEPNFVEEVPLLIMQIAGDDIALKIDQFHEGIDIVQKPLSGLMAEYNYYAGSALLGDGRVLLILNIKELVPCQ